MAGMFVIFRLVQAQPFPFFQSCLNVLSGRRMKERRYRRVGWLITPFNRFQFECPVYSIGTFHVYCILCKRIRRVLLVCPPPLRARVCNILFKSAYLIIRPELFCTCTSLACYSYQSLTWCRIYIYAIWFTCMRNVGCVLINNNVKRCVSLLV